MKRAYLYMGVLLAAFATADEPASLVRAKVLGSRVNVRAKADLNAEVVGQLAPSDEVEIRSVEGDWVRIVPPDHLDLWVNREMVLVDEVVVDKANVRAGAGINYAVVGTLARGEKILPRGEFTDWLKIAAPTSCSLWVSKDLLLMPEDRPPLIATPPVSALVATSPSSNRVSAPVPLDTPKVAVEVDRPAVLPAIEAPADLKLLPVENQGQPGVFRGVLKPVGYLLNAPAPYRLVSADPGATETICYLRGNRDQLRSLLDTEMSVDGAAFWIQRERAPVVLVQRIQLHDRTR